MRSATVRRLANLIRFKQHPTETACWIWTGYRRPDGRCSYEDTSAHYAVYRLVKGAEPTGRLKPRCGRKDCVNPHHMKEL